ncbi:hypothetical protein CP985_10935 [Malaciobacter mytili LMG 24559]|uniref:Uncharacterized protein n=1 Tax=Malaciobacter mytili LMG 24559 TaxID=1032238 RepID=A0AAX2ADL3_9BACT|nr:hypothetical protein [Malaciobacter mytili]AXH16312.1 hypothetical protein AMYT_a0012 [Malaciobacter mytili LMG 24559]RXK14978.1 hypothetical protein CP985_10935 [Malaciobacter mytili LMG 24559]
MKNISEIYNDNGPFEVFVFYSFLLIDKDTNKITISSKKELREVFLKQLKLNNKKYKHLPKEVKRDLKNDLIRSYVHIKNTYF